MIGELAARWADSRSVEVGGQKVRYRESGRGSPIVLVHGLGVSSDYWFRNAAPLAARGFRVLAPDLPGFGRTAAVARAAEGPGAQADALAAWADTIGLGSALYVGHSLSGQSVLELAVRRPELVTGLVLAGPSGAGAPVKRVRQLGMLAVDATRESARLVTTVLLSYLRAGPVRVLRTWWNGARHDPIPTARRVRAPALVVVGTRDPIVDPGFARLLAATLPRARLAWVGGGTHAVHHSHPAEFNDLVAGFAAELAAGTAT